MKHRILFNELPNQLLLRPVQITLSIFWLASHPSNARDNLCLNFSRDVRILKNSNISMNEFQVLPNRLQICLEHSWTTEI